MYLALAIGYNWVNPLFESPDELLHYDFVVQLRRTGELPIVDPEAGFAEDGFHASAAGYKAWAEHIVGPMLDGPDLRA